MKIYMVELHDYDRNEAVGYFTDRRKADACRDYLNSEDPSDYNDTHEWHVVEYDLDETDYDALNKEIEDRERNEFETRMERIKQEELAKLEELKSKYEEPKVAKWTLHKDGSGTCSHCHFTQKFVYDQDNFNRFCSVCGYKMTI